MTNIAPIWDVEGFLASPHAARTGIEPAERATEVEVFLGVLDPNEARPDRLDGADVHAWIGHILPAAYAKRRERAPVAAALLRAYFEYLDDRGVFSDGYEVRQALENVMGEFLTAVRTGRPVEHHHHHDHGHHGHGGGHAHGGAAARSKTTGRNDPCPCGSGQKYKKCCGRE